MQSAIPASCKRTWKRHQSTLCLKTLHFAVESTHGLHPKFADSTITLLMRLIPFATCRFSSSHGAAIETARSGERSGCSSNPSGRVAAWASSRARICWPRLQPGRQGLILGGLMRGIFRRFGHVPIVPRGQGREIFLQFGRLPIVPRGQGRVVLPPALGPLQNSSLRRHLHEPSGCLTWRPGHGGRRLAQYTLRLLSRIRYHRQLRGMAERERYFFQPTAQGGGLRRPFLAQ